MKKQYIYPSTEVIPLGTIQYLCGSVNIDVVTGGDVPLDPGSGL